MNYTFYPYTPSSQERCKISKIIHMHTSRKTKSNPPAWSPAWSRLTFSVLLTVPFIMRRRTGRSSFPTMLLVLLRRFPTMFRRFMPTRSSAFCVALRRLALALSFLFTAAAAFPRWSTSWPTFLSVMSPMSSTVLRRRAFTPVPPTMLFPTTFFMNRNRALAIAVWRRRAPVPSFLLGALFARVAIFQFLFIFLFLTLGSGLVLAAGSSSRMAAWAASSYFSIVFHVGALMFSVIFIRVRLFVSWFFIRWIFTVWTVSTQP